MIKVLFFGSLADKLAKRNCLLSVHENMTLADVVSAAGCAGFNPLLVAVNQEQVSNMNTFVHAGDEIAIMPPFSGG